MTGSCVTAYELAVLVLHYLDSCNYRGAAQAFRR